MPKFPYLEPGSEKKYLTAIVICVQNGVTTGKKYRNIRDGKEAEFISKVAVKFRGATHVNFYYKAPAGSKRGILKHRLYIS